MSHVESNYVPSLKIMQRVADSLDKRGLLGISNLFEFLRKNLRINVGFPIDQSLKKGRVLRLRFDQFLTVPSNGDGCFPK